MAGELCPDGRQQSQCRRGTVPAEDKMAIAKCTGFQAVLAGAICLWGVCVAQAIARPSLHRHDGTYALHIVTTRGSCPRTFNTRIVVRNSQIHATGHPLVRGSGHIQGDRVVVTLHVLHHPVHVTGRMRGRSASGRWSSQSMGCTGTWHAMRQG